MIKATYDTLLTPLSIDVSTGDAITPHAVEFTFHEIFDEDKSFKLWAYNIETVLAEKVETILRRTVLTPVPEISMMPIFLQLRRSLIKALLRKRYKLPLNIAAQQGRFQMWIRF